MDDEGEGNRRKTEHENKAQLFTKENKDDEPRKMDTDCNGSNVSVKVAETS